MRTIGAYLLMFGLVLQMVSSSLIVLNYRINTAYIIENFCVNKDRPELKCNGKCHLSKQIRADEERRSEAPIENTELILLVFTANELTTFQPYITDALSCKHDSPYRLGRYSVLSRPDHRPPQV